jgi:hypothetical protein
MEQDSRVSRSFRDVDQSDAPEANVQYLATASGIEQVQRTKARTIKLLDL